MSEKNDPRSLDLCAIGLGQGGGNLAAEWRRRGYRAVVFNTARADLRGLSRAADLDVPTEHQHYIGIEGSDGAGRDPEFGRLCVREHAERIREVVSADLAGADALLLCAGLGGGTGSSCDAMIEALAPLEIPILTVTTLPADNESGITKVNAVKSANAIVGADLAGRIFLDNERLQERFPDIDVVNYYPTINAKVLGPVDELNRLNGEGDLWSIRTFDGEDFRKVLLSGGVLQHSIVKIPAEEALTSERLVGLVQDCVGGGKDGATGLTLSDCAYVALVLVGPEELLKETPARVVDNAIGRIKDESGGAAVYEGMYVGPNATKLKAYVVTSSLALPNRVEALLGQARAEGGNLAKKIQGDIKKLELSPLDGLDLFRAPSRKSKGPRAPAPAPRPLSAPLLSEADQPPVGDDDEEESEYDSSLQDMSDFDLPPVLNGEGSESAGPRGLGSESARARLSGSRGAGSRRLDSELDDSQFDLESVPSKDVRLAEDDADESAMHDVSEARANERSEERTEAVDEAEVAARVQGDGTTKMRKGQARPERKKNQGADEVRPRVGTGRYDDDDAEALEATAMVDPGSIPEDRAKKNVSESANDPKRGFDVDDHGPRVGTGAWRQGEPVGAIEATHLVDTKPHRLERPPLVDIPAIDGTGRVMPDAFDLGDDDDEGDVTEKRQASEVLDVDATGKKRLFQAEGVYGELEVNPDAPGFELAEVQTHAVDELDIIGELPERNDGRNIEATTADTRMNDDELVSSMLDPSSPGLQGVYEDLIERFRQAADKRGRDRVARRLIEDARSDDVEVRALAVWAMVKLEETGFRRALRKAKKDVNPEIQKLAESGLARLPAKSR